MPGSFQFQGAAFRCLLAALHIYMPPASHYVFATCRPGAEPLLKRDVALRHSGLLTPAFMRPQLITWKVLGSGALPASFRLGSPFSTVAGQSLGTARTVAEVLERAADSPMAQGGTPMHLHIFPRETPDEGTSAAETWEQAVAWQAELRSLVPAAPGGGVAWFPAEAPVRVGEGVLNVILGVGKEPALVGWHRHGLGDFSLPGGLDRHLTLPEQAPSRAWLKMEQALAWLGISTTLAGRTVLELGSAPGGGSYSLLTRGAEVFGVDTGEMSPLVLQHPQFHHLRVAAGELKPGQVPAQVDLIASDMNLEPQVVCRYVEKFSRRLQPRALLLTLKINSPQVAARLPDLIHSVSTWAPGPVQVRQLPANRQEVTLVSRA